jgi:hypothetical protein
MFSLRLKLTSAYLGNKNTREHVRKFDRTPEGLIRIDKALWLWAFQEALEAFQWFDIDSSCIRMELTEAPATILYNRRWRQGDQALTEKFEAISKGGILGFRVLILNRSEAPAKRPPSLDEFRALLNTIGQMIGVSPWGSKFEYGRFLVLSVDEITSLPAPPKVVRYTHHGIEVAAMNAMQGRAKEHSLCHQGCKHFTSTDNPCSIQKEIHETCIRHGVVTPVFECPKYETMKEIA